MTNGWRDIRCSDPAVRVQMDLVTGEFRHQVAVNAQYELDRDKLEFGVQWHPGPPPRGM